MKIALLAFSFLPKMGGAEIFTYNLLKYLKSKGNEVDLYLPRDVYKRFKKICCQGVNAYPIFFKELAFVRRMPVVLNHRLLQYQRKNNYDMWQVVGVHPAAHITRKVSKDVPVVVRAFGADIQIEESINYGFRLRENLDSIIEKSLSSVAQVTALTPSLALDFKALGVPESKITLIPNGVDLKRFENTNVSNLRARFNINTNEKFILTTGRYHIKKGYEYIPEAIRILLDNGFQFKWVVVGKDLDKISKLVAKYDISENLILVDEIGIVEGQNYNQLEVPSDDLLSLYKSADFYVSPSLIEGMSNAMLEAMAAGLPVVTTDSPGCRDLVKNNMNGLLCEPKSGQDLASKIERLFNDESLQKLKKSTSEYIKNHSWDIIGEKYLNLYKKLVE